MSRATVNTTSGFKLHYTLRVFFHLALLFGLLYGCAREDFDLPDLEYGGGFASHEIYNRVQPDIILPDSASASDIYIGANGTVFVAETALNRIGAYDIMGQPLQEHGLGSLMVDSVLSVTVDNMMNLLAVNGTRQVFLWNQLVHTVPVDSIYYDFVLADTTQVDSFLSVDVLTMIDYLDPANTDDPYIMHSVQVAVEPNEIEPLLAMSVYETDQNTHLMDISADPDQPRQFFATDNAQNRIFMFKVEPYALVFTADILLPHLMLWRILPEQTHHVVEYGTGFGYANKPNRIHVDKDGDFYFSNFSWTGSDFQLHKTMRVEQGDGSFAYYPDAGFLINSQTNEIRDVFDTLRYEDCWDLTTTANNIYVVDRGLQAVQVFSNGGEFITYAGVDIHYTDEGEVYEFGELVDPVSVDYFGGEEVDEDISALLFVLDRGSDRIVRYEKLVPEE